MVNVKLFQNSNSVKAPNSGRINVYSVPKLQHSVVSSSFNFEGMRALAASNMAGIAISFKGLESEITPTLEMMNSQLRDIKPEHIDQIVSDIDCPDKEVVIEIMKSATQFGNIDSLNSINEFVQNQREEGYEFYSFDNQALGIDKIINYLTKKKAFTNKPIDFVSKQEFLQKEKGALLLDANLISYLKSEPELLKHIEDNDFRLVYPQGWESGVTAFSLSSLRNLKEKAEKLSCLAFAQIQSGDSKEQAVENVLDYDMKNQLEEIGLHDKLLVVKNEKALEGEINSNSIANNLASKKMTELELEEALPTPYGTKQAIDILQNDAKIVSMRDLGCVAEKMHEKILKEAEEQGFSEKDICYWLPYKNKSYAMIAYQYQKINDISPDQFFVGKDSLPKTKEQKMVVVLDDYSGSGQSIREVSLDFTNMQKKNNTCDKLVVAPYYVTSKSAGYTRKHFEKEGQDVILIPGKETESYFSTDKYLAARREAYYSYADLIGRKSYGFVDENIAFPYMSPDNNTQFFADKIAKHYTFNSAGVKTSGDV